MDREEFLNMTTREISCVVRDSGPRVCVFPFNGTRRWFLLEHGQDIHGDAPNKYLEYATRGYINTYKLVFDYGIDTIVAPVFGSEILTTRGEKYMREIGRNMTFLATHRAFLELYRTYDIRVHFYGDFRKQLGGTPYETVCKAFDEITQKTAHHTQRRLFYGVFAEDATDTIAELSIKHYKDTGEIPTRRALIEEYYGEYIEKADLFIGFEKFNVFDYPMLGWGGESLYFTVTPSLYMGDHQLRDILYDYMYNRQHQDPNYLTMPAEAMEEMRQFYEEHRNVTLGVGNLRSGIWYPII